MTEPSHSPITVLADRYSIGRTLGSGGMATVYLARDLKHDREVAVKVLHPHIAATIARERFLREIRILGRLQHPNIVPLFDSGEADGLFYFVMPRVKGDTLRASLKREHRLTIAAVVHVLREVAGALAYAHDQGVVHRDVKPENLLLINERVVVSDFGIARATHAARSRDPVADMTLTIPGTSLGTPAYMAPEQAAGATQVDARADLYALGVVAYEMLAGRTPFQAVTREELLLAQSTRLPMPIEALRPDVPPLLAELVMQLLQRRPEDRPPSARILIRRLEPLEVAPSLAASTDPGVGLADSERIPPGPAAAIRTARLRRLVLGVLAVGSMGALAVALYRNRTSNPGGAGDSSELNRIAVLYFDDATPDGRLRWLANGLTEDLIDALSSVNGLTVISPNGVQPYQGVATAPQTIANSLNVGLLIDGTLESAGASTSKVSLVVRLIDARTGVQLERETVTRDQREPNGLRHDLSSLVEMSLRRRIGAHVRLRQERLAAASDAAWELVRRARDLVDEGRQLEGDGADLRFRLADSLLAAAEAAGGWAEPTVERAALALIRGMAAGARMSGSGEEPGPTLEAGIAHATRALQQAPWHAAALAYRGDLRLRLWQVAPTHHSDSLLRAAQQDLLQASALDPGLARAWYTLGEVYQALGDDQEAGLAARKALAADIYAANAPTVITRLFFDALGSANAATADSLCAMGRLHFPADPNFRECVFTRLGWLGSDRIAVDSAIAIRQVLDTAPGLRNGTVFRDLLYGALLARAGLQDSARQALRRNLTAATRLGQRSAVQPYVAYTELLLEERDRSIETLRRFVAEDTTRRSWVRIHPWFRSLHADPRFQKLTAQDGR